MKKTCLKRIRFKQEPYTLECPTCKVPMIWNSMQGPGTGGWKCPKCGRKIDHKG